MAASGSGGDAVATFILGVGAGVLVGAAVSAAASSRRAAFSDRLRVGLERNGIRLLSANLGRNGRKPVWVITVERADGVVQTLHGPLAADAEPYALATCDRIVARLVRHLRAQAA